MKNQVICGLLGCSLLLGACGGSQGSSPGTSAEEHIDVAPSSLEQASREVARANELLANGADQGPLMAELAQLRDHMDTLNGLIDKVEVGKDHVVSFFRSASGSYLVRERAPQGATPLMPALDLSQMTMAELHLKLAPSAAVPAQLLEPAATAGPIAPADESPAAAAVDAGASTVLAPDAARPVTKSSTDVGMTQSALTANDGPYFRANYCPNKGFSHFCLPDWGGGAYAYASPTTHSDVWLAPYSGSGSITITLTINGSVVATEAAFVGEIDYYYGLSGAHSVRDSGCCFFCACGTHLERIGYMHRWDVGNAAGKGFHFSGYFLNDPQHLGIE